MKSLSRIFISIILLLSIILSASSCVLSEGIDTSSSNSGSNQNSQSSQNGNTDQSGSTDGNGNDSGSQNGNTDQAGSTDGNGNEGGSQNGEDEDPFVPDMTKLNTLTNATMPHFSYSYTSEDVYNNDLFYKNSYDIALGDPSVFSREENGVMWFYVTGTTTSANFEMWKTPNFTDWEMVGTIYSPGENFFGKSSFWAPQLFYDAEADWQYYLGESSDEGKGLYMLFFSARKTNNACALSVAFSKKIEGPYKNFTGINANGDYVDESNSCFEIEKLKGLGLYAEHVYGNLYKKNRSFIDASPFVDPVTGEKYLYMVRNRNVDSSNDVWGVKMKDWVTPDYETTAPLTSYGYTDVEKSAGYGFLAEQNIDEGPFMYYKDASDDGIDNGKYYLTFSIGGTDDKLYPVCQATGDSPLGPFTKVQPEDGGILNTPEMAWDIHSSGHHAFFEVGDELFIAYHTYEVDNGSSRGRRYFAFDKIEWIYNQKGEYLMRSNGPSKSIQPLPSDISGYNNIAKDAVFSVDGEASDNAGVLSDGIIALRRGDENMLFSFKNNVLITLSFDEYVSARAIMIYNSYDYDSAFSKVNKIEFSYRKIIDGRLYFGVASIDGCEFNFKSNLIPKTYLAAQGESDLSQLRPASALIAEFSDIEINSIKIYMSNYNGDTGTSLSEIVVLGKEAKNCITDESIGYGGYTHDPVFDSYSSFGTSMPEKEESLEDLVVIDGRLKEELWMRLATLTVIEGATKDSTTNGPVDTSVYGEREARVYTYLGKRKIYFAFDVTDKNLFFNSSQPQGRSTCIEIYFTTADNNSMSGKCYSVRINPTGKSGSYSCKIGVYVPNAAGNEWAYSEISHNVQAVAKVNGTIQTSSNDPEYSSELNQGYTVEIAIDKILIGLDEQSFRFTAAFVQDRGYDEPRIANTFIPGTHYIKPYTWIVFKNKSES